MQAGIQVKCLCTDTGRSVKENAGPEIHPGRHDDAAECYGALGSVTVSVEV